MKRLPPRSTRTDTPFPSTTLSRSATREDIGTRQAIDRKPARKHRIQLVLFTEPRHRDKNGDEEASGQCQPEIMRHAIGRQFQDDTERTACFRQKIEEPQEPFKQKGASGNSQSHGKGPACTADQDPINKTQGREGRRARKKCWSKVIYQ